MARSHGWDVVRSLRIAEAAMNAEQATARTGGALDQLAAALVKVQSEMQPVAEGSVNPFFNSTYADLADLKKAATPIITQHGLAVSQFVSHDGDRDTLVTWLLHESGQFIADEMLLHLPKDDPQGQGSAITYAKRYAYQAALGIVTDVDDDGNTASNGQAKAPANVKPSPAAQRPCALCDKPLNDGSGQPVVKGQTGMVHKACLEADEKAAASGSVTGDQEQQELAK